MQIEQATKKYETWMASQTPLVLEDLENKHARMASDRFSFFRATFYRWMQLWPETCGDLARAPKVLAVGDLHIENFGTWRDREGRLVWGVNDFDEAAPLPYTADLVRLAAGVLLAHSGDRLAVSPKIACEAILTGYAQNLQEGGAPFVLSGPHAWMRVLAESGLRDPAAYWQMMKEQRLLTTAPPEDVVAVIEESLPEKKLKYRIVTRIKGVGSLGRPRFIALAHWHGGMIAREVKRLVPSACGWAAKAVDPEIRYGTIVDRVVRSKDPFVNVNGAWLVRRLAPDCARVELASLSKATDEERLLRTMGRETANIHLGTAKAVKAIQKDLKSRPSSWLIKAAKAMVGAIHKDWERWSERYEPKVTHGTKSD